MQLRQPGFSLLSLCLWVLVLLIFPINSKAQNYEVRMHSVDNKKLLLQQYFQPSSQFPGSSEAFSFIQQIVPALQEKGYLAASVDSMDLKGNVYEVFVFLGNQYRFARILFDSIPQGIIVQAGINKLQWSGRVLDPRLVAKVSGELLTWAENNGYPFARVWLDAVDLQPQGLLNGQFLMDKGPLQKIDSIEIHGGANISSQFLMNYLDIRAGDFYNEKKLRGIASRLKELAFLQETMPWAMEFKLSGNILHLYLKEKNANQINGIVGLLPNHSETGKLLLTVDALFSFRNILNHGESISLSYQNLQYRSPRLIADAAYPFIANTPFGADGHFELFKKDTAFRRTSFQAGLRYQVTATDFIRGFYQTKSNRLITVDTALVRQQKKLPEDVDVSAHGAGLELVLNRTDYRINPAKGWDIQLSTSVLRRKIRKSDAVTGLQDVAGFDFEALYDTLLQRKNQFFLKGNFNVYWPLARKIVFKNGYSAGWVSGSNLFRNEMYQIGGFRLLRGFDEQSIFTNHYHVLTFELRVLLEQNSYFYLFSDNGYAAFTTALLNKEDLYNGFGLGAALETKSGLFSLSYGLGRSSVNPVQFRQSKIHFGYVAYF